MKVPGKVLERFHAALPSISVSAETAWAIDAALEAALEVLREELAPEITRCLAEHGVPQRAARDSADHVLSAVLGDKEKGR